MGRQFVPVWLEGRQQVSRKRTSLPDHSMNTKRKEGVANIEPSKVYSNESKQVMSMAQL